uniref:Pre-mRNA-splicing factor 38B n=1 Tax=Panagrolaimus sp. JU765 TaxID=591449 RepID=A0AC34RT59_9BILA
MSNSNSDNGNFACLNRLEGTSGQEQGGLFIPKKSKPDNDDHLFKKPSLFGLDKLARAKKEENLRKHGSVEDTPGITDSVRNKIDDLKDERYRQKQRGIHQSKEEKRKRSKSRSRSPQRRHEKHRRRKDDRRDRDHDRHRDYDRSDRHRSSRHDDSDRRREREWETPKYDVAAATPSKLSWDDGKKFGSARGWTPRHNAIDEKERSLESAWRSYQDRKRGKNYVKNEAV